MATRSASGNLRKQVQTQSAARGRRNGRATRGKGSKNAQGAADLELAKQLDRRISGSESFKDIFPPEPQANTAPAAVMHPLHRPVQPIEAINVDPRLRSEDWPAVQDVETNPPQTDGGVQEAEIMEALDAHNKMTQRDQEQRESRRFIDPQPDARRIDWDDSQTQAGPSTIGLGKRPFRGEEGDDIDPSQDTGFQADERNIDVAARRRLAPPGHYDAVSGYPEPKRARVTSDDAYDGPFVEELGDQEQGSEATPPSSVYQQVKAIAKENRKNASISASAGGGLLAPPTVSTPPARRLSKRSWSHEEEQWLIDYIGEIGCSWAEIKRNDDLKPQAEEGMTPNENQRKLDRWTQVDLKDKAVGIKAHYMQSRMALPLNFEGVSLRKRDKDRLRGMGIDPDG